MCVGGYNHVAFYGNMAVVVLVFAELRWRLGRLCAEKARSGTAIDKKMTGGRRGGGGLAREGERDACGGGGAHFGVVRHIKVPI